MELPEIRKGLYITGSICVLYAWLCGVSLDALADYLPGTFLWWLFIACYVINFFGLSNHYRTFRTLLRIYWLKMEHQDTLNRLKGEKLE